MYSAPTTQAKGNSACFKRPGRTSCLPVLCSKHPIYLSQLGTDQTCWLHVSLMWDVNAFQVPAYFNFLSAEVLGQYFGINCTFLPTQPQKGCYYICAHTPSPFQFTNTCSIIMSCAIFRKKKKKKKNKKGKKKRRKRQFQSWGLRASYHCCTYSILLEPACCSQLPRWTCAECPSGSWLHKHETMLISCN